MIIPYVLKWHICDNQVALRITFTPIFHEKTKYIEINYHFIREKIVFENIKTEFVNSNDQLINIFTKSLRGLKIDYICNKLGTYDLYTLTWGGVLEILRFMLIRVIKEK